MARIAPTLLAAILVVAALIVGITAFAGRDEAGLDHGSPQTRQTAPARLLPAGIAPGNVVIRYRTGAARRAVDALAEELGAADTPAARAAGQAIIPLGDRNQRELLIVITDAARQSFADADDPAFSAYVRGNLGRTGTRHSDAESTQ